MLAGFDKELEALSAVELHTAVQTAAHTKLVHLVDAPRLVAWAAECKACHTNLAQKVNLSRKYKLALHLQDLSVCETTFHPEASLCAFSTACATRHWHPCLQESLPLLSNALAKNGVATPHE